MCANRLFDSFLYQRGYLGCFQMGKFLIGNCRQIMQLHGQRGSAFLIQYLEAVDQRNGNDGTFGLQCAAEAAGMFFVYFTKILQKLPTDFTLKVYDGCKYK